MQKKRMKLCGNCDGVVDLDVIICPFCGSDVTEVMDDPYQKEELLQSGKKKLSVDETLSSLYPPPYNVEEKIEKEEKEKKEESKRSIILPFLSFSIGINFFLFSIFLILFSENGELFLRWDTTYWFIYSIFGIAFAFLGYKFLNKYFKN